MPPSTHSVTQSIHRRGTASARQRENRTHHVQNGVHRRRKSRSPDARILDEIPPMLMGAESGSQRRRKKTTASSTQSLTDSAQYSGEDVQHERGRRGKAKARAPLSYAGEGVAVLRELGVTSQNTRSKKKERSKSRDTSSRRARTVSPDPNEDVDVGVPFTVDGTDVTRMQHEIETLRKQLQSAKKSAQRQNKVIDELRKEVANHNKTQREQLKEMDKWKAQVQKSDELVSNFEQNLSCQICMDLITQPHGLPPCGHVACQTCLQGWFRSAPAGDDEMYDEDEPDTLIYRKKTCPCCRAVVSSRPIPLFVVKSLTSALEKAKAQPGAPRRTTPPPEEGDPWAGIFADADSFGEFWPMDEDDDEDEDDDFDEEYDEDEDDDDWSYDGYGTGEDEEPYHGPYVRPQWEPPTVHATADDFPFHHVDEDDLRMLRRGATLQMIDIFEMSYTHEHGLCASVGNGNAVFLGWNVFLHPEDGTGEVFIDWVTADVQRRPERWDVREERNGGWTAWKLVPEGDEQDYETSDSETWAADLVEDEEF